LEELEIASRRPSYKPKPQKVIQTGNKKWKAHVPGSVKVTVDGGLSRQGNRGAIAAICRDDREIYMGASAVIYEGLTDPASLEALACNEAISLALDLHVQKIQASFDWMSSKT
jgi:hypothetical protein